MIVTTNVSDPDELNEQIGHRTVSRLEEMCQLIPLHGNDQRQQTYGIRSA